MYTTGGSFSSLKKDVTLWLCRYETQRSEVCSRPVGPVVNRTVRTDRD